jgi:hypothetical protein
LAHSKVSQLGKDINRDNPGLFKGFWISAVLSVAGMNDPLVIVWQPAKFAALQNTSTSGKPVLLQVNGDTRRFQFHCLFRGCLGIKSYQ